MIGPEPAGQPERLAWEVARVSDRLRTLPLARLSAPFPPYESRAAAAHALAQRLAAAAQGIESRDSPDPPAWREVPRLADHAAGDQVAVTGRELLDALLGTDATAEVWTAEGRRPVGQVTDHVLDALRELRLGL